MHDPKYDFVLVTGGAGYVGSHLVRKLLDRGYKVRVLDSLIYKDAGLAGIKDHERLEFVQGDMRHIDTVIKAVRDCDAVIDLAAIVGDPACVLDPDAQRVLSRAATVLALSARSHDRILKVARTIADLAGAREIAAGHVAEALQFRCEVIP